MTAPPPSARYDPDTNLWSGEVAPLGRPRSKVCLAEMEGHLYALGGHDGTTCTNIVERYKTIPLRRSRPKCSEAQALHGKSFQYEPRKANQYPLRILLLCPYMCPFITWEKSFPVFLAYVKPLIFLLCNI